VASSGVPHIALIIGSTRPNRFADVPAKWLFDAAAQRHDMTIETLDLRDWALPFFEEPASPSVTRGVFSNPVAERWGRKLATFDGFVATAAEYNHGPTAVLKNALDSAFIEWAEKPISFVGYGGVGGARAVEHLRMVAVEMQMAPIKQAVHIGLDPFIGVLMQGKSLDDYPFLAQSRTAMLDRLVWWANALKTARSARAETESIAA
jgi:NAD(P)H-dependent FMN reductase